MVTAIDLITDALEENGYKSAETPLTADDIRLSLRRLNMMLEEWEGSGRGLGASAVMKPSDVVRIPIEAESSVMYNLSGRLAGPMRITITVELAASISAANTNLLKMTAIIGDQAYPDTLPIGSGNNCDYGNFNTTFFPENEPENF